MLSITRPVGYGRCDIEEDLEANLRLGARSADVALSNAFAGPRHHLRYHFSRLLEVGTSSGVGLREEVLDQTESDVVAHSIKLPVDFGVVALVVLA